LRALVRRRAGALRAGFAAAEVLAAAVERLAVERLAVERFAVARFAAGLRAAVARVAPLLAALARVEVDLRAPVAREAVARLRVPAALRVPVARFALPLRAVEPERDAPAELARAGVSSPDHLPLITRCAASATASAINAPNFVALDIMLVAACDALSAASRPASRIARRAFGLALIAAAAAARPAASISLLIAALASLSTVALPDDFEDRDDPEELLREDFAICFISLRRCAKDTSKL
jgi:hypothetical protein